VQYEYIWPLRPDRCRSDRCAPCYYHHLKIQALNGGRDKLSPDELEFVGEGVSARVRSGGWHQPDDLAGLNGDQLSAEDSAMLAALMDTGDPGQERMRFLG
jgi:hypothetical protein